MDQELKVANELLKLVYAEQIPASVAEDIHQIYANLVNGDSKVTDLIGSNPQIEEILLQAIHQVEGNQIDS